MFIVIFKKDGNSVQLGAFKTKNEAVSFIEEDTSEHKPYMRVVPAFSPIKMRNQQG